MLARLMIDAIMHQTTVLIAGLSTAAGIRAPLANVADQVFLDLAKAIEEQGVGRKVAADMFGMALRTYQKKVLRLAESSTAAHRTLWEAVLDYLEANPDVGRAQILKRFAGDGEDNVAAVLNDLVESGVLDRRGRGVRCTYRLRSADAPVGSLRDVDRDELGTIVWVFIYRRRGATVDELVSLTNQPQSSIEAALSDLSACGRVAVEGEGATAVYRTATCYIPVGAASGWAGAVIDHYQAMCSAIVTKLQSRGANSHVNDVVGGATLGFDVYPGHPHEEQVYALLRTVRADVNVLWNQVSEYNRTHPVPDAQKRKVHFYFGQTVQDGAEVAAGLIPAHASSPARSE